MTAPQKLGVVQLAALKGVLRDRDEANARLMEVWKAMGLDPNKNYEFNWATGEYKEQAPMELQAPPELSVIQ